MKKISSKLSRYVCKVKHLPHPLDAPLPVVPKSSFHCTPPPPFPPLPKPPTPPSRRGIKNYKNSCYFVSIIQMLADTPLGHAFKRCASYHISHDSSGEIPTPHVQCVLDVATLINHVTMVSTISDTKVEEIVSRCLPFMLGTLPPGAFHDAHQALISLQNVLNHAFEGSGGNVPIVTSALRTSKCCGATEQSPISEDYYTLHSSTEWTVSDAITFKLLTEEVSRVLCEKCLQKNDATRSMSTKEWPRTLSIHIPDTSRSDHRMSLDSVLTPPGLSNGSYALVSCVEFNESAQHYRYKNYDLTITVDSDKVTSPISTDDIWRPYLVVYKHTKKNSPKRISRRSTHIQQKKRQ